VRRLLAVLVLLAPLAAAQSAHAANLRAGVGKADITPRTGYYLGGWTRQDRVAQGQHTRLWARAIVLKRGDRKVALVAVDLFMVPGGLVKHVGDALASRGFSESNLLVSASHTHSGPGGYANFKTFNTAAPGLATATDPLSFYRLLDAPPADPQLYTFLVHQVTAAVRRADADLGPARAGWGRAEIHGLTMNRSIEAHLADHNIIRERGSGSAADDPEGVDHTIDPRVNVLRVDKVVGGRRVPIGGWSTFADHGTVTKSSFQYYNEDHHASAIQVFEQRVRRAGRVPRRQLVLNVYGNSNEGDQSAGLVRDGPAASDYVGRVEAAAMVRAWRRAGTALTPTPELDVRWTRTCFCGQATEGGNVADYAMIGFPFLTGSEEERGPLFDVTHTPFEGMRNPLPVPGQGHKQGIPLSPSTVPKAVPLTALRVGDGLIVTLPGEPTTEVGSRVRAAVQQTSGLDRIVVSGLAGEFIQYLATPEEYDRQHYEGGSTLYGPLSSNLLRQELAELARRLVAGEPAQAAYPLDPTNGIAPNGEPYGRGAATGTITMQPARVVRRFERARFDWRGGAFGLDRPVGRAFVLVQRRAGRRWRTVDSDLGLGMLWKVDDQGNYSALWEVPREARAGRYRLRVRAKQYRLTSLSFRVRPSRELGVRPAAASPGHVAVTLDYPQAVRDVDLRYRPPSARGGVVRFRVNGKRVVVRSRGTLFEVARPDGATVSVPSGAARDRHGNRNGAAVTLP
jgi:neutral ceramidase